MTTVLVEEDEQGEQFIQLPQDMLDALGWDETTELVWTIRKDGAVILEKYTGEK